MKYGVIRNKGSELKFVPCGTWSEAVSEVQSSGGYIVKLVEVDEVKE